MGGSMVFEVDQPVRQTIPAFHADYRVKLFVRPCIRVVRITRNTRPIVRRMEPPQQHII